VHCRPKSTHPNCSPLLALLLLIDRLFAASASASASASAHLFCEVHSDFLEVLRLQMALLRQLVHDLDQRGLLDRLVKILVHDQSSVGAILLGAGRSEEEKESE
jgi:hypothetical protein